MSLRLANNSWFTTNRKFPLQMIYLTLVLLAIILTGVRAIQLQGRASRSDTLAIVMGVKSLVFFAYQLSTTYLQSLRKWRNLKAYMIIDYAEIIFWLTVLILGLMGVSMRCVGSTCALGLVVAIIAILLMFCAAWLAVIATLDFRHQKSEGSERDGKKAAPVGSIK